MGKITGGAFGIIRGKTSGLNFRYAGGNNIVSKYVPNPRNPKTPAQINARDSFKFLAKMFQELEPLFLSIGFNQKTIYKKNTGLAIQQLYENNGVLEMTQVPAHNWLLHQWRIIVDTIRGHGEERYINPQPIISTSILFDRLMLNPTNHDGAELVCSWVGTSYQNIFRALPQFLNIWEREKKDLMPWGVSICTFAYEYYDEDFDEVLADAESFVNVSGVWGNLMYSPPPNTNIQMLVHEISKHEPTFNKNASASAHLGNKIIQNLPLDLLHYTKMSGIKRHSGVNLQVASFDDQPEDLLINWNFPLLKTDWNINIAYNSFEYRYTFDFIGSIPDAFTTDDWRIEFHYFKYDKTNTPTRVIISGTNHALTMAGKIEDLKGTEPLCGLLYIKIADKCYSLPIKTFNRPNNTYNWYKLFYVYQNESPFRNSTFALAKEVCGKVFDGSDLELPPLSGVTVDLLDAEHHVLKTTTSDGIGWAQFGLDDGTYIGFVRITLGSRTAIYDVDKTFYTGEACDLGRLVLPEEE